MKKGIFIILFVCILSACTQQGNKNNSSLEQQEGIIVDIKENQNGWNQILVVSNVSEGDISNKKADELIKMAQEKDGAYYGFEPGKYEELEVGTHVIVYWDGSQLDSNPPQRGLEKVEIISK
ncbi:DUF3221 domain-containing protein [Lysinibacillus sp. NPDC095746]|uniref:DUF3221 domain-containing protein n=1 Tax=Lysinibacillus sp. NPDC095746 TaxID=3364134 RepID=UPI0038026050